MCGSTKEIVTINSDAGGYLCKDCYTNEYITDEKIGVLPDSEETIETVSVVENQTIKETYRIITTELYN